MSFFLTHQDAATVHPQLSEEQLKELEAFYEDFEDKIDSASLESIRLKFQQNSRLLEQAQLCLFCSEFVRQTLIQWPEFLAGLLEEALDEKINIQALLNTQIKALAQCDADDFNAELRRFRQFIMTRIIWRDANKLGNLRATCGELSELAEQCLAAAVKFHRQALTSVYGEPCNAAGEVQPMLILGMGKLGARELNLSSDIDLIFAFPDAGETKGKDKQLSNQEFFSHLGKRVIQSLDARTKDGFVFRVDMRLRPYGQSGALVSNFHALEDYYQSQGREWERYAMVKARVVFCDGGLQHIENLNDILKDFTYRKYIDFSVIDALRKLKEMIRSEVKKRKLEDDVKLGAGGIREVEFIAQVFQLIRGGRDSELQDNRIHNILPLLDFNHYLPSGVAGKLLKAYEFLRNTEHAIQGWQDKQTQKLPSDKKARAAIYRSMQFDDWDSFAKELNAHQQFVKQEFEALIADPDDKQSEEDPQDLANNQKSHQLWNHACRDQSEPPQEQTSEKGSIEQQLYEFSHIGSIKGLTSASRERLDEFMPALLARVLEESCHIDPLVEKACAEETLSRLLPLVKAISRRSAYLILLLENPGALDRLVTLSESSEWIAAELSKHPALLDELIDPSQLYHPPEKAELQAELKRALRFVGEAALEEQMEALRYFRSSHAMRVAASEITGALPLMKVSDYLTVLAEVVLEQALQYSWHLMVERHGFPDGLKREAPEFLIVGYGKLGGIELNHGSDLDLVFIHDADINGYTDGERSIDNQTFYTRLGQKLIHILSTRTASGRVYEIDMRLRPSGNSGLLATKLTAFEKYQENDAWTWEHQALVRARVIAGDPALGARFEAIREKILKLQRNPASLCKDIIEMREKMRSHLGTKNEEQAQKFHLKQDAGGIVDIEFMVQYAVLAWAHAEDGLTRYTDNIRILECLAQSKRLPEGDVERLIAAYKALRVALHRLTLEQLPSTIEANAMTAERTSVIEIWQRLLTA